MATLTARSAVRLHGGRADLVATRTTRVLAIGGSLLTRAVKHCSCGRLRLVNAGHRVDSDAVRPKDEAIAQDEVSAGSDRNAHRCGK